jgi:hypothetical protein
VTPCDHQGSRFLDHDGSSHRSDEKNCSNSGPSATELKKSGGGGTGSRIRWWG